jgi:hypothetical protein
LRKSNEELIIKLSQEVQDKVLKELNLTENDIAKNLSGYAIDKKATGRHQPAEFVAEAFAEYMDSPNPRPIARKVGEILKSYLEVLK